MAYKIQAANHARCSYTKANLSNSGNNKRKKKKHFRLFCKLQTILLFPCSAGEVHVRDTWILRNISCRQWCIHYTCIYIWWSGRIGIVGKAFPPVLNVFWQNQYGGFCSCLHLKRCLKFCIACQHAHTHTNVLLVFGDTVWFSGLAVVMQWKTAMHFQHTTFRIGNGLVYLYNENIKIARVTFAGKGRARGRGTRKIFCFASTSEKCFFYIYSSWQPAAGNQQTTSHTEQYNINCLDGCLLIICISLTSKTLKVFVENLISFWT